MENQKSHPVRDVMQTAMESIKEMIDVNTIIGEQITTEQGVTIIPVSKVGFGFASGGSDFSTKNQKDGSNPNFGGGGGAGVNITPVAFLVIAPDGHVSMLNVQQSTLGSIDKAVDMIPGIIDKFKKKSSEE